MKSSPIPTSRPADRLPRDRRIDLCYVIGILLVVAGPFGSGFPFRFDGAVPLDLRLPHAALLRPFGLSVPLRRRERTGRCGDFRTPPCAAAAVAACRVDDARIHPQGAVERLCHAAVGVEFFSLSARLSLSGRQSDPSLLVSGSAVRGESCGICRRPDRPQPAGCARRGCGDVHRRQPADRPDGRRAADAARRTVVYRLFPAGSRRLRRPHVAVAAAGPPLVARFLGVRRRS